jgi:hypothetical protein
MGHCVIHATPRPYVGSWKRFARVRSGHVSNEAGQQFLAGRGSLLLGYGPAIAEAVPHDETRAKCFARVRVDHGVLDALAFGLVGVRKARNGCRAESWDPLPETVSGKAVWA